MKFRFRLDPVLGHRERLERERAGVHGRALADQLAAKLMRDEMIERRDAMREQLVREHAEMDVQRLRSMYAHLDYLDRTIVAVQQRVDACADETERARIALVGAAKDRKMLEALKDRRREAFALEAAHAEQRELDDQNARLFDRAHPFDGISGVQIPPSVAPTRPACVPVQIPPTGGGSFRDVLRTAAPATTS